MNIVQVKRVVETVHDFQDWGSGYVKLGKDERSLSEICRECGISRSYWYQLEGEDLRSPATEEVIRKVETVLGVDLGVRFND